MSIIFEDLVEMIRMDADFMICTMQHLLDLDIEEAYKRYAESLRDMEQ